MPFPQEKGYTSKNYWNLPEDHRAELIDGKFYVMAPPKRIHQELVLELSAAVREYIREKGGNCKIYRPLSRLIPTGKTATGQSLIFPWSVIRLSGQTGEAAEPRIWSRRSYRFPAATWIM